jgi:hypothetical protein
MTCEGPVELTAVTFGASNAEVVKAESVEHIFGGSCERLITITAVSPPGKGIVDVTVTAKGATSLRARPITSLPWTGEFIERETQIVQMLMHHVKWWVVFPPPSVGTGVGCLGTEFAFGEREGATEKEEGDELAPMAINGAKNGLKASHFHFEGQEGKTEKGFPRTGRLISEAVGPGYETATGFVNLTISAAAVGSFELMTWE